MPILWSLVLSLFVLAFHAYYISFQTYVCVFPPEGPGLGDFLPLIPIPFCYSPLMVARVFLSPRRLRVDQVLNGIGLVFVSLESLMELFCGAKFYRYNHL